MVVMPAVLRYLANEAIASSPDLDTFPVVVAAIDAIVEDDEPDAYVPEASMTFPVSAPDNSISVVPTRVVPDVVTVIDGAASLPAAVL
jgi:hypothetical protein